MKSSLFLLIACCVLFSCQQNAQQLDYADSPAETELAHKIDEYFSALHALGEFNGVVYASKNKVNIIHKAYNLNQDTSSSTYVSPESQFDIHSVSKLMGHYLIEKFELEGKLKKSQTIDTFISDFPKGENITIDMLLHHTSGLPRSFEGIEGDAIDLTSEQIIAYTKKQQLLFEPGTRIQYSNVAYELIYFIIQQVSAKSFTQCVSDEIFQPLGMTHSGAHFHIDNKNVLHLARNHEKVDSDIIQVDNILAEDLKTARIFSTATDLNQFLNHIRMEPYASLLKDEDGVIEKSGGSDGIRVEIYTDLTHDFNFIFLANYEEVPFVQTVKDFASILAGKPYEVPKELNRIAIDLPTELLQRYVGTYAFADMGDLLLKVDVKDGNLVVYQEGEIIATLQAESQTTFFENPTEAESFEFIDNGNDGYDVLMGFKGVKLKGVKQ